VLLVGWRKVAYQSFIAPIPPAIMYGIIGNLWVVHVFPVLTNAFGGGETGMIIAAIITVLFAILFGLFFFTMYGVFGGWDDHTIGVFKEAVEISSPSKFLFNPILKVTLFLGLRSNLHGKFPIPHEEAVKEAAELMQIRHIKDALVKEISVKV
jgi:hypothetical protein